MREFRAGEADVNLRADVFIARQYPSFTRSSLEMLFDTSNVRLNAEPIKPSYRIRIGDSLSVDEQLIMQELDTLELPVIYEDDDVIVINKPAGILTHSKGALNFEATVASFVKTKLNDKTLTGNRAGIAHRLDRQTSGVIIAAKNAASLLWLQKQFSARKVKKTYLAVVEGELDPAEALIDAPIARNPKKPQIFYVHQAGKPSQTQYKAIKTTNRNRQKYSLVELKPLTGRTHQIRVHMAYIKHPVAGDPVYGRGGGKLMLHSESLELTLPNRQRKVFNASPPGYIIEYAKS